MHSSSSIFAAVFCALSLAVSSISAIPLRGFVVDATSSEPLGGANLWLEGTDRGTAANRYGFFVIGALSPGHYTLQASRIGYQTTSREIEITGGIPEPIRVELPPQTIELDEVTIIAEDDVSVDGGTSTRFSTISLNTVGIRRIPSLGAEKDVLRAVQALPGVKASSDANCAPHVRGGSPDQTLILLDQNVIYNPFHMFGLFSTFNTNAVKRVELHKGGFPAEYGGRSGSVLHITTKEGNRLHGQGIVSVGTISGHAAYEGPLPNRRGSFALSVRRTYLEPMIALLRKAYDADIPSYYFYDANGKVNLDVSDRTTLSTAGYVNRDDLDAKLDFEDERLTVSLNWGNATASARLRHVLGTNLYLSGSAAVSRYTSRRGFDSDGVIVEEADNTLIDYSMKADLELLGSQRHRPRIGIMLSRYDVTYFDRGEDITWVDVDTTTYNAALYAQDRWHPADPLEITAGVRGYYHHAGTRFRVDPRLSLTYSFSPTKRFRFATGHYTQWINIIALGEGFSGFDFWIPVDGSIGPPTSNQVILGFEYDMRSEMTVATEAYYTDMENVTTFDIFTDQGETANDAFLAGDGFAAGWELMLHRTRGPVTGWIGYSLSWTQRRFPGSYVNGGKAYYPKWDRRHDLVTVAHYTANDRWDFGASWRYNTGQGFTQALGVYALHLAHLPIDKQHNDGRFTVQGSRNNYRFPADHRLDLSATWKHMLFGRPARLHISLYNAYSRRSYWIRYFDTAENPVRIRDIKLFPILPLISYEVRF